MSHKEYLDCCDGHSFNKENIWLSGKSKILSGKCGCEVCKDKQKYLEWEYTKPIIGWDKNNQPIFIDSWGAKK